MKKPIASIAILAPAAGQAHEVGIAHLHPHLDPTALVAAVAGLGVLLLVAWARDGEN
jgi:hypothetical protein